jgi:hypothetical protein
MQNNMDEKLIENMHKHAEIICKICMKCEWQENAKYSKQYA